MAGYLPSALPSFVPEPRLEQTEKPNVMGGALDHWHTPLSGQVPSHVQTLLLFMQIRCCSADPSLFMQI